MSAVIQKFTKTVPQWRPRVTPLKLEDATDDQLDALKVTPSNTKVSDYVLVLAHDVFHAGGLVGTLLQFPPGLE